MRLLFVALNFAPEPVGAGRFTGETVRWLAARGHEVSVVCARPHYPAPGPAPASGPESENFHGARVIRLPLPRAGSGLTRHLAAALFGLICPAGMIRAAASRPQAVVCVAPTLAAAPACLAAARLARAPAVLHVQDFELQAALNLGFAPDNRLTRSLAERLERSLYRRFAAVTTISPSMAARLEALGVDPARVELVENFADPEVLDTPPHAGLAVRRSLGIAPHEAMVLYSGSLGRKQGAHTALDAAAALAHEPVRFVFCGRGPAMDALRTAAARRGLSRVIFTDLVARKALGAWLGAADCHLVMQRENSGDFCFPSRLANILAAGGKVVAAADPASGLGRFAAANPQLALWVPPGRPDSLAQAIAGLARVPGPRFSRAARDYARDRWHPEKVLGRLERLVQRAAAASPPG